MNPAPPAGHGLVRFPELEALRGIAISLVVAFHIDAVLRHPPLGVAPPSPETTHVTVPLWLAFVQAGNTGVTLFFVLSGFLLSRPFLAGQPLPDVGRYFRRRGLRILPVYYVAVLVAAAATSSHLRDLVRGVPYLFLLNGAGLATAMLPYSAVWWSLATEVQFYLALPLIAACWRWRPILAGAGLALWALAYALYLAGRVPGMSLGGAMLLGLSLFGRAPAFLLGAAAAYVHMRHAPTVRAAAERLPVGAADALMVALLLALGRLLQWAVYENFWLVELPPLQMWHAFEAALWGGILLTVLTSPLLSRHLVDNAILRWLGTISYSLYLIHFPVLVFGFGMARRQWGLSTTWNPTTAVAATALLAVSLVTSAITYRVIERPFLAAKSKLAA